ncbi:hypothetical protein JAAARDRAFT_209710 [Jaapia argillacea MUCL 33604]|uniref:NADH:flavin oxidoreductase/NADH oxidase N-terminal domain-containing protein n=1 Tax=Jaapia argillacea MUCL 33604 TaxID=933084 RepID=A0A067PGD6_9AGAM|nr:hypothetical protein JAAARDRAFT_209710 [Jaapia argillacea MUCL 33604]
MAIQYIVSSLFVPAPSTRIKYLPLALVIFKPTITNPSVYYPSPLHPPPKRYILAPKFLTHVHFCLIPTFPIRRARNRRVVMVALTRLRATSPNVPTDFFEEYYTQLVSTSGTLIISEATCISPKAGGVANTPGIWNHEQIVAWKKLLRDLYPDLAYLHITEPRVGSGEDREAQPGESNDFISDIWSPRPLATAGGYTRDLAIEVADKTGDLIAFGRQFISNPDLPLRLKHGLSLKPYDRKMFYAAGTREGYIDYPFAHQSGTHGHEETRAQL